ncbi:Tho complex subunit 7-domain-containing protein [Achaetomium macrosporum]|uniref:Tho complex subunit 7-domain-containing protein n=1 Tax=Achaetomium macrosporum TaxID=79813 RepID=A0AAN7HCR3_9PEZI|nr:Tho complex subunit 7-domain-containing protein [Achaetomium macrosporum]
MASWGLLDDKEENELHKSRLLNVEEKPFKRVTKRLNSLHALTLARARQAPTPPPETNGNPQEQQQPPNQQQRDGASPAPGGDALSSVDLAQLKEDITLDFAAFDSSIARLQFLLTANERERERYAAERQRILTASQSVRDNTAHLRTQLEQARATLAQRRKFDELADAITSNPSLRARAEQAANLRKLEEEIAELEVEREAYGVTWNERREQFARIMDESMRLRRLIRDEKEEVERREGMDDDEAGATPRPSGIASRGSTPRPENGLVPKSGAENGDIGGTPRPVSTTGGRTPARESPAPGNDSQSVTAKRATDMGTSFWQVGSQMGSREGSVDRETKSVREGEVEEGEDVEMADTKDNESEPDSPLTPPPADDTPQIVIGREEGDSMDTT